jgi:quercetin dioxygenase-like cupin family protein
MKTRRGPEEWFTGAVWMDASPAGPPADVEAESVVYFAPGERHWHGAGPDSYMVHAAVSPAANSGGGTDWLGPVTDEQYAGA